MNLHGFVIYYKKASLSRGVWVLYNLNCLKKELHDPSTLYFFIFFLFKLFKLYNLKYCVNGSEYEGCARMGKKNSPSEKSDGFPYFFK